MWLDVMLLWLLQQVDTCSPSFPCPPQLASEFTLQAESTEKAWEKALRREKDKSERILDNMESMAKDMVIKSPGFQSKEASVAKQSRSKTDPPTPGKAVRFDQEYIDGKRESGEMLAQTSSFGEEDDEEYFEDAVSEFFASPQYASGMELPGAVEGEQDRGHKRVASVGSILEGRTGALDTMNMEEEPRLPAAGLIMDNRMHVSSACMCVCVCGCMCVCVCGHFDCCLRKQCNANSPCACTCVYICRPQQDQFPVSK